MTACVPRAQFGDDVRAASSMENGQSSRALPAKAPRRGPDAGWAEALPAISCWTNIDVDLIRVIKELLSSDGKPLLEPLCCAMAPRSPRSRQRLATGGTDPEADLWWVPAARRSYSDPCGCRKGSAWSGDLGNAFASPTGTSSPGTNAELPGQKFSRVECSQRVAVGSRNVSHARAPQ